MPPRSIHNIGYRDSDRPTEAHVHSFLKPTSGSGRGISHRSVKAVSMGGDLGRTGGRSPQNLRWGTADASVSPIFGEVVLTVKGCAGIVGPTKPRNKGDMKVI